MLNGEAARYRTQDMVRASEMHRTGRGVAKRRSDRRRAKASGILSAAATLIALPIHR
jgi:hypothetical protein